MSRRFVCLACVSFQCRLGGLSPRPGGVVGLRLACARGIGRICNTGKRCFPSLEEGAPQSQKLLKGYPADLLAEAAVPSSCILQFELFESAAVNRTVLADPPAVRRPWRELAVAVVEHWAFAAQRSGLVAAWVGFTIQHRTLRSGSIRCSRRPAGRGSLSDPELDFQPCDALVSALPCAL